MYASGSSGDRPLSLCCYDLTECLRVTSSVSPSLLLPQFLVTAKEFRISFLSSHSKYRKYKRQPTLNQWSWMGEITRGYFGMKDILRYRRKNAPGHYCAEHTRDSGDQPLQYQITKFTLNSLILRHTFILNYKLF
jgi:hypothetical protein